MNLSEAVVYFRDNNDSEAGQRVFEESYKLASSIIRSKFFNFGYSEDLFSKAHDTIVDCINDFNPNLGKFSTYCYQAIYNNLLRYTRKRNRYLSSEFRPAVSCTSSCEDRQDLLKIVESLNKNHYNSLIYGTGSKQTRYRARKSLLQKLRDEGFVS